MMNWEDERYVRVYTRDTPEWTLLSWEARAFFWELMRKVDRAGILELGRSGLRAVAGLIRWPVDVVDRAVQELVADGCLVHTAEHLYIPNFTDAQDSKRSDKERQRASREKRRAAARGQLPLEPQPQEVNNVSRHVTDRHGPLPDVTSDCDTSRSVTPSHAVPTSSQEERDPGVDPPAEPEPAPPAEPSAAADAPAMLLVVEPTKPKPEDEVFAEYLAGWKRVRNKGTPPKLTDGRRKLVRKRLRDHPVEELKGAAAGIWCHWWNVQENQTSFELALRDTAHVEKFLLEYEKYAPKSRASPKPLDDDAPIHPALLAKVSADAAAIEKFKQKMLANGSVAQNPSEGS